MIFLRKVLAKSNTISSFHVVVSLICIGFLLYGLSLFNGFIGDDQAQIVTNEAIKHLSNIFSIFGKGTFTAGGAAGGLGGIYYKPLMTFSFALVYAVFGLSSFGYHFLSLSLHIANAILLFFLVKRFFTLQKFHYIQASAFLLSLIFLIHPGNSETVLYIADMQDLLVAFFLLISLLLLQSAINRNAIGWKKLIALGLMLFFGLLSKESGIVALLLVCSYVLLFANKLFKKIGFLIALVFGIYLFFRFQLAHIPLFSQLGFIPIHAATLTQRMLTIPYELFSYIRLVFFPQTLFLYQHDVVLRVSDPKFFLTFPVVIFVISIFLLFGFLIRSRLYTFFLVWMFFGFGIVMNIIPLDMTLEERWLYLPFIGVLCALFCIAQYLSGRWKSLPYVFIVLLFLLLPWCMVRSFERSKDFRDNLTLYAHDVAINPHSYELLNNYGVALLAANQNTKAKNAFTQSLSYSPQYWPAYSNLGLAYAKLGDTAKAKQYYRIAIGMSGYFTPYENLAQLTLDTEKPENVVPILQKALFYYPNNAHLLVIAAKTYLRLGKVQEATLYAKKAVYYDNSVLDDPDIQSLLPMQY